MQRKLFNMAAASVCGALVAFAPAQAFAVPPGGGHHSHYYYLSMSSLPRQIESTGTMKFINTAEGLKILYTHCNESGKKPTADAEVVHFLFGCAKDAPVETHLIANRSAYAAYKARIGAQFKSPLLVDKVTVTARPAIPPLRLPPSNPPPEANIG